MTATMEMSGRIYNRYEKSNIINVFFFGIVRIESKNQQPGEISFERLYGEEVIKGSTTHLAHPNGYIAMDIQYL